MNIQTKPIPKTSVEYPDSDGQPMADNTLQFRWIVTIEGNLDGMYIDDANVFVAGDLLWYPVQGQTEICTAPDVLVAFGRPKGRRGSYKQWEEGNIAPQVVFEIWSPSNTAAIWDRKLDFFNTYGVDEYYIYDPDDNELFGWKRQGNQLEAIKTMHGWISPRLGIRFDLSGAELVIYRPDGQRFLTFAELLQQQQNDRRARELTEQALEEERRRAKKLADRLKSLGVDPEE